MSLDVYNRSNEFKPLDYQQQIDLYKKYTELKKSPQITQSQEFNRRISLVVEKATKQHRSTNEGLNSHHKSTLGVSFDPSSNNLVEEEKTQSGQETTGNRSEDKMDNQQKKKSQSTTNIDKESTKQGSLFNLSKSKSRTLSQSPNRANDKRDTQSPTPNEQSKPQTESQPTEKKKNGLIKRLSLRFKSHSVDHAENKDPDNKKSSKKGQQQAEPDPKSKKNAKTKDETYAEMYNKYISAEKTKSNTSLGKAGLSSSTKDNRAKNIEYENSEKKNLGSSHSSHRHDNADKRTSSQPVDPANDHQDFKLIKVKLENQPKQHSQVNEEDINIQTMRQVFNIFDRDRDGSITIEDVQEVMKSMNNLENELEMPSIDQIKEAFVKYDENKNGRLEFNEFLNIEINAAASTPEDLDIAKSVYLPGHVPDVIIKTSNETTRNVNNENDDEDLKVVRRNLNVKMSAPDQTWPSVDHQENNYARSHSNNSFNSANNEYNNNYEIFLNETTSNLGLGEVMKANMKLIFEQFDKDHDGRITRHELNFVMSNLFPDEEITEQDINNMLKAADLDNNGFIDFDEFSQMFSLYGKSVSEGNLESIVEADSAVRKSRSPSKRSSNNKDSSAAAAKPPPSPSRPDNNKPFKSLFKQHSATKSSKEDLTRSNSSNTSSPAVPVSPVTPNPSTTKTTTTTTTRPISGSNYKKVVQIFTTSQLMDLKAAFTMFDKNGDQKISETELFEVMCYLGVKTTQDECRAMIRVVDKNRNGYVDYDEFIQMMTHTQIKPLSAEDELKKTFDIFDIDRNGFISADEIKKTMENLGESLTDDEVRDMIKAADRNGDGKIDLNEFSGLLSGTSVFHAGQR